MRWAGEVGFVDYVDDGTGLMLPQITEHRYTGTIYNEYQQNQLNSTILATTQLSASIDVTLIPADYDKMHLIRFVRVRGIAWTVTRTTGEYPRVTLYLGGRYNGD